MCAALAACGSESRGGGSDTVTARAPTARAEPSGGALSGPLQPADFVVAGIDPEPGVDSAAVVAALGAPDSILLQPHPWDTAGLRVWYYGSRSLEVALTESVQHFRITGSATATGRGVRVGDLVERVRAAYGERHGGVSGEWRYDDDSDPSGLHGIVFHTRNDRVTAIHLGATGFGGAPPPWQWAYPPWLLSREGLGPITRRTSERDLVRLVGAENVQFENLNDSDEGGVIPGSILPGDLIIVWADDSLTRIADIVHGGMMGEVAPGFWRTARGVTLGTTLGGLQRLNGRPFTVAHTPGTYWEARIVSWEGGNLTADLDLRPFVVTVGSDGMNGLTAEQRRQLDAADTVSSALPALRALNPAVDQLWLRFR
jgi:hypothetical protein